MYNPIIRSLTSFTSRQYAYSPYFDERLLGLSFHQYLSINKKLSLEIRNALTKEILCKEDSYEVSEEDYELVRRYLDEYAIYDTLPNSKKVFDTLRDDFLPEQNEMAMTNTRSTNSVQNNCVNQIFKRKSSIVDEMYGKYIGGNNIDTFLQKYMQEANEYDSMLYIDKHMRKQK